MNPLSLSRAIVVVSTVAAAFVEVYLATTYAPPVLWIALVGFVLLAIAGTRVRSSALPVLMATTCLAPAILLVVNKGEDFSLDIVWLLPLLGLLVAGPGGWRWSLPERWQWPLVTWSVVVSIAWPIVFLRETDFAPWILPLERVSNTSIGIGPWQVGLNVVYFALSHNAGILFVDALCRWFREQRDAFRREVLAPLAIAAALASAVAFYQGFVDLSFLNRPFWTYMIRASGTLADPNKLGAVVAFWTIGAVVFARKLTRPWSTIVTIAALMLGLGAVWLCGSRTGLAAVAVSVAIAAFESVREWRSTRSSTRADTKRILYMGAGALVLAIGLVVLLQNASTHTVIARGTWTYIPLYGDKGVKNSINELLWERFGYGPAAIEMIKEHPIDGVGIGVFHSQVYDFGKLAGYIIPQPDNAQMWLRHHLAELGILGSLPLLWWCVVFGRMLFTRPAGDVWTVRMLRGVMIGFFVASTFGMPAQSIAIVITFWVFAFWMLLEHSTPAQIAPAPESRGWSNAFVIAATLLIVIHAGSTVVDAFGDLRPRERAQRFGWYYRYGFVQPDDVEKDPGGNPVGRRWTTKDALAVIPVKGKVLKFVGWIDHPDADTRPVHTRVWADSMLIFEGDLKRRPLFLDIPPSPGKKYLVLEIAVDRLFRPSDSGKRDSRELGLSIRDWVWE
jgi:hypothetical protein